LEPGFDGGRDWDQPVQRGRIWAEAGLKPHLVKRFKISNDPQFEEKVTDVVGLYLNRQTGLGIVCGREEPDPGARSHAAGPALEEGPRATMTHDYKRHGTTTLFAALDVKSGLVIGECQPRIVPRSSSAS